MGYLCVNFSLPRPLYSRLRPDVRDIRRQTSDVRLTSDSIIALSHRILGTGAQIVTCSRAVSVVDRGVLQAMWAESAGEVGHRDQLIIC